jgi:hypothetical protein
MGGTPQTVTYSGTANDGSTYTLKVTENSSRAAYAPEEDDEYELTFVTGSSTQRSTGIVISVSDTTIELKPSNSAGTTFTVTVSGNGLTKLNGTVTWTTGSTNHFQNSPLTPVTPPGGNGIHVTMSKGPAADEVTITLSKGEWKAEEGYNYFDSYNAPTYGISIEPKEYTKQGEGSYSYDVWMYRSSDKNKLVLRVVTSRQGHDEGFSGNTNIRFIGSSEMSVALLVRSFINLSSVSTADLALTPSYDKNAAAIPLNVTRSVLDCE